jgi:hypothetical protein
MGLTVSMVLLLREVSAATQNLPLVSAEIRDLRQTLKSRRCLLLLSANRHQRQHCSLLEGKAR